MPDFVLPYSSALIALLVLALLMLIQFAVADVAGIRAKHVPGMPITGGHESFLFRAVRAHANSNENLPLLLLLVLVCLLSGANAQWTAIWIWTFVAARVGHMLCYYADWRLARSGFFVIGTVGQAGLFGVATLALVQ